ncbi:MAG TPA: hypothetical protein VGJ77_21515, partial [Gaiellaceae bacterium]
ATEVLDLYRELGDGEVSINPSVYVGDWDDVAEHFLYQYNRYREWGGEPLLERAEDLPRERYIVGTPDDVAAGIRAIEERTRCDRLFFWARPPGLDIERSNRSLELFAREVIPRVQTAART